MPLDQVVCYLAKRNSVVNLTAQKQSNLGLGKDNSHSLLEMLFSKPKTLEHLPTYSICLFIIRSFQRRVSHRGRLSSHGQKKITMIT